METIENTFVNQDTLPFGDKKFAEPIIEKGLNGSNVIRLEDSSSSSIAPVNLRVLSLFKVIKFYLIF